MSRFRLRRDLFKPPTLRVVTDEDRERHATWMELFSDLAVVAVIGQLGGVLHHDYSAAGLFKFFILFLPVWWAWVGNTFYLSRFDSDDLVHRLFGLIQIALIASLAMSIPGATEGKYLAYVASYVALRLLLIFQYFFAGLYNPHVRKLTNSYITGFGAAVLLWVLSLFVPPEFVTPLWGIAILVDFSVPVVARSLHVKFPPNASHLPERFGLLTIIVLGETVLAAVVGAVSPELFTIGRLMAAIALIMSFSIWWLYFEGVSASEIRLPTDRASASRYQLWMFSHVPLHMAIIAGAIGMEHALHLKPGESFHGPEGTILASVVFAVMLSMHLLFNAALPKEAVRQAMILAWPHFVLTGLTGVVIFFANRFTALGLVSILATLLIAHVIFTLRDRAPRIPKRDVDISDYMAWWDGR